MKRIRVAASPARLAAQTQPIPSGEHLAQRMPMRWEPDRRRIRWPIVAAIASLPPVGLLIAAALLGVLHV